MEIDIQPLFTHIDAGIDWRHRVWFGQYLALHAGLAPHHLFRTNARTDGPSSSPVLAKGRAVPPVRTPADGHPPGFATFFAQMLQSQHARGSAASATKTPFHIRKEFPHAQGQSESDPGRRGS